MGVQLGGSASCLLFLHFQVPAEMIPVEREASDSIAATSMFRVGEVQLRSRELPTPQLQVPPFPYAGS